MQKPNAFDLIQQVRNYFLAEYGLTVNVKVSCYNGSQDVSAEKGVKVAKELHDQFGGEFKINCNNGYTWATVDAKRAEFSIFYDDVPADSPQTC